MIAPGVNGPDSFTSIPTEVVAMRWTGDNIERLWDWIGASWLIGPLPVGDELRPEGKPAELFVAANDSFLPLTEGCWIIQDQLGFYPCEAEIFEKKYRQTQRMPWGGQLR